MTPPSPQAKPQARDRLILALDLPSLAEAETMIALLGDALSWYKVGYQLLPLGGYDLARRLHARGKRVFVDAKLLDIGATVERGTRSIAENGADMLTVHADPDTVRGAAAGAEGRLEVFAVTVLTSWDQETLNAHGIGTPVEDLVLRRAELAAEHGAQGVIASAQEATAIRARFGDALRIVTPGIRPAGSAADDQKRVVTPPAAIAAGADRLVVGRPILRAADPLAAARAILDDITLAEPPPPG